MRNRNESQELLQTAEASAPSQLSINRYPSAASTIQTSSSISPSSKRISKSAIIAVFSNLFCISMAVVSVVLVFCWTEYRYPTYSVLKITFSSGLFGFLSGITNWIGLKMLFDKIPLFYGSGVIPRRFKPIRESLKNKIMRVFFDRRFLEKYASQKMGRLGAELQLEEKIKILFESSEIDEILDTKLSDLSSRPEGLLLSMHGVTHDAMKPLMKPFLLGLGAELAPLMYAIVDPVKHVNVETIRMEIDHLLSDKLLEISPEVLSSFIKDITWDHVSWIIIWGNIFGLISGALVQSAVEFGVSS